MSPSRQSGAVPVIVLIFLAIAAAGGGIALYTYIQNNQTEIEEMVEADPLYPEYEEQQQEAANAQLDYPDLYRQYDLPEYPNGELTSIGRQQTSLSDGLKLMLDSDQNPLAIGQYYENEMTALGWSYTPPPHPTAKLWGTTFQKDGLTYQIIVVQLPTTTQITISFFQ